ncbi:MAG: division/cell wall cluster transcriptional repressor MraZ [Oscillospiraceae bacterium]|nr:division/cell wall cluster transcriptional repressor MraZ [Oscillospiraceae bacterium]
MTGLYGRYQHNIDAKGRLFVPAKLREKLGNVFMAAAVLDRCVSLYAMDEWDRLIGKLNDVPMTQARGLQRHLSANALDVPVDTQGRILLPRHLLDYAGLTKDALVVGAGNHAEIWEPAAFDEGERAMTAEQVESLFAGLGF